MQKPTIATVIIGTILLTACGGPTQRPSDAAGNAQKTGELAANPEQARLWKEAAEKNKQGLEKIPLPNRPVQQRPVATVPNTTVQTTPTGLPQGMQGGIRIISFPNLPGEAAKSFNNTAQVRRVEGEQIELDLGQQRTLTLYAKARGGPLRARAGESSQLDLRFRDDPFDRQQILALRLANGDGVISALDSGDKPVTLNIRLFRLTATQIGNPERNSMQVAVTVGGALQVLSQGQVVDFAQAGLTVGIVGSSAYVGPNAPAAEGRPYALNLVAWPNK
jgi:hypothetical protein